MFDQIFVNDSNLYQWVLIPLLIFCARVMDMSLDTMRIMLVNKGMKKIAPLLGFFQVLIWLVAIQQVMINMTNVVCYIAYAGGFAVGTYVGMVIEEKLAIGMEVVRVITHKEATDLINHLREQKYGVTNIPALGMTGQVSVIYTIVKRSDIPDVIALIRKFNPKAFYTIESIRSVNQGVFR